VWFASPLSLTINETEYNDWTFGKWVKKWLRMPDVKSIGKR